MITPGQVIGLLDLIVRLVLATLFGAVVGYQRELADRPAGLRTHVLVCLGSALIMIVSIYPFSALAQADPSRIAAGAITGIGFLGAGTIIRQGNIVRGLTTAASLWTVSGIGLAIGSGFYIPALLGTAIVFLVLAGLKRVEQTMIGTKEGSVLRVMIKDRPGQLGKIGEALGKLEINIRGIEFEADEEREEAVLHLSLDVPSTVAPAKVLEEVSILTGVHKAEWLSEPHSEARRTRLF